MANVLSPAQTRPARKWRGWWLRQIIAWHWISAAIALVATLLFAVTGITLNHAASIPATPVTTEREGVVPVTLRRALTESPATSDAPLPSAVAAAVQDAIGLSAAGRAAEWSDGEVYVALPRAGGDAWVSIDRRSGRIMSEVTDRGWVAYLHDLHKGRNTGAAWFWFIDVFAGACVLFAVTGLLLLQMHARRRSSTWPLVAAGFAIPAVLAAVFVH